VFVTNTVLLLMRLYTGKGDSGIYLIGIYTFKHKTHIIYNSVDFQKKVPYYAHNTLNFLSPFYEYLVCTRRLQTR